MDKIFDRLGNLLRSFIQEEDIQQGKFREGQKFYDPDMQEAWEELDDFLNEDREDRTESRRSSFRSSGTATGPTGGRTQGPPLELAKDYRNLEVDFGSSFEMVKKAHKKLLTKYHPDRHAGDPEKLKSATEITQRINQSFQRIKKYHETGRI